MNPLDIITGGLGALGNIFAGLGANSRAKKDRQLQFLLANPNKYDRTKDPNFIQAQQGVGPGMDIRWLLQSIKPGTFGANLMQSKFSGTRPYLTEGALQPNGTPDQDMINKLRYQIASAGGTVVRPKGPQYGPQEMA
jgi:hypothetical protein